mgnify:CR=1 FL=1
MFLNKERFLSYIFSLFLLTIFINTVPIPQLPKYILFILINFFFFISLNKKVFYKDKKFIFSLIIFIFIIIITNIAPIKFSIKVNSFGNAEINSISLEAQEFYKSNFPECYNNANNCYWIDSERPLGSRPDHPLFLSIHKDVYKHSTLNDTLLMLMNAGRFHAAITDLSYNQGHLLFGSSANLTLTGTRFKVGDMQPEITSIADIIIDYGLMKYHIYGQSSTLLDVETLQVYRYGICYENIVSILKRYFAVDLPKRPK